MKQLLAIALLTLSVNTSAVTVWILIHSQRLDNNRVMCVYDNQRGQQISRIYAGSTCPGSPL